MDDIDVFLSYYASEARDFASHLYVALKSAGLSPFMDRRSLVKGADTLRFTKAALEMALVHVVVISESYVEIKSCLRELVAVMRSGKPVVPVFYDVEPRKLLLMFPWEVYCDDMRNYEDRGLVKEFQDALTKLADMSGSKLYDHKGDEAALVQEVVDVVRNVTGVPVNFGHEYLESSVAMDDFGVLINHGPEVKGGFASHLYAALKSAGLSPLLKDESDAFTSINGLETAMILVVVVSKSFRRSRSWLNQLVAIMRSGKPVIPVFYGVETWELWHTDSEWLGWRRPDDPREEWEDALQKLGVISGFHHKPHQDSRDGAELVQEVVDEMLRLVPILTTLADVGGPSSVYASHEYLESSGTMYTLTGPDCPASSAFAQGNAAAMEQLGLYLRLGEQCLEAVQSWTSPPKFNNEQCEYLADKLQMFLRSASAYLYVLRGDPNSSVDVAEVVEVFKFLRTLAKQIESFVHGCCQESWIQSAMTLTNVWEYVASVGFNLELCRAAFCMECGCLSLAEVEEINKVEVEVVKKKAFSDVDALSQKILLEGPSLSDEDKDLAFYLLRRLNQDRPIPGVILHLCDGSIAYDGGWLGRLYKWVKPSSVQLGKGASGTVHKAMWLGTPVARKMFGGQGDPDFVKEVEVLSALSHPNAMSIFCSGTNNRGCCSIIMELMDEDLHSLMERRLEEKSSSSSGCPSPFPILEAVGIMLQIGEGGKYLHDQEIAHRDLKSMNILAKNLSGEDSDGYVHVKVADFGLSKTKEKSIRYSTMSVNLGTSRWMAPEIIRLSGSDQGRSSSIEGPKHPLKRDIYSYGMVCFEILTGRVPFSSVLNEKEVKSLVLQGKRPILPEDPQKCPLLLKELIESCWSSNPGNARLLWTSVPN